MNTHRAVMTSGCVFIWVPFCGWKLPDLTPDEFNCKHLRVFCITDESKYLKGNMREDKNEGEGLTGCDAVHRKTQPRGYKMVLWELTSPKGLMVTMLYEAGSLSTRHVSVRASIRLTGSGCRGVIFCTTNSASDVMLSSELYFPNRSVMKFSKVRTSFLSRSVIPMKFPACSMALRMISSRCSEANKCWEKEVVEKVKSSF